MKSIKTGVEVRRLDENRYAVMFDGVARFVGSLDECERRAAILLPRSDRAAQDKAVARVTR